MTRKKEAPTGQGQGRVFNTHISCHTAPWLSMARDKNLFACPEILEVLQKAMPTDEGFGPIGNEPVFRLCQYLKGVMPEGATSDELHPIILQWWERSKAVLIGKGIDDFTTVWIMFCDLWDTPGRIKYPKRNSLQTAIARAKVQTQDRPELLPLADKKLILLGHVCYELQRLSGNEPFFLSGKDAGQAVGMCEKSGGLALKYLQRKKIIERVKPGYTGKSTEYRYIGQCQNDQNRKIAEQIQQIKQQLREKDS